MVLQMWPGTVEQEAGAVFRATRTAAASYGHSVCAYSCRQLHSVCACACVCVFVDLQCVRV